MNANFLTCETREGLMDIYVAGHDSNEKRPVVIVLMEAFGVNHHIRSVCDRFAAEGFLAAAPDLYHRQGRRIEVPYEQRKEMMPLLEKLQNQDIVNDVRNTINFLGDFPVADLNSVSTCGFCVGGYASVQAAMKLQISKMIAFYPGGLVHERPGFNLKPLLPEMHLIKSRCLFFFGGQDASIPLLDVKEIEKKMTASKVAFEVDIFPRSDHGFFCDERKSFNPEDAGIAWKKVIAFLRE